MTDAEIGHALLALAVWGIVAVIAIGGRRG